MHINECDKKCIAPHIHNHRRRSMKRNIQLKLWVPAWVLLSCYCNGILFPGIFNFNSNANVMHAFAFAFAPSPSPSPPTLKPTLISRIRPGTRPTTTTTTMSLPFSNDYSGGGEVRLRMKFKYSSSNDDEDGDETKSIFVHASDCDSSNASSKERINRRSMLLSMRAMVIGTCVSGGGIIIPNGAFATTDMNMSNMNMNMNISGEEPRECRNGAIVAESAVPGAYQQTCMNLPNRSIQLTSTGDVISVWQGTASASTSTSTSSSDSSSSTSGGVTSTLSGRTGVALWNSGILLTRLLDIYAVTNRTFLDNKTVLELGCGTGMASIAAHKLGAGRVIATDGNEEVVQLAQRNLERNNVLVNVASNNEATMLQWGALNAIDYYQEADVVIGSDLTYNAASWGLLAETFDTVLKPDGMVLYLTLGHSGFAVEGELGGFLTTVQSKGCLEYMKEDATVLERFLSASLSEDEKRVIQGTGGFKVAVFKKKKRRR